MANATRPISASAQRDRIQTGLQLRPSMTEREADMEPTPDSTQDPTALTTDGPPKPSAQAAPEPPESPQDAVAAQHPQPPTSGQGAPPKAPAAPAGKPIKPSPAEMVAAITADQDHSLDKALEEAMSGFQDDDLSADAAAVPMTEDPAVDSLVTGRIANIGSQDVLVDFGTKSLGVMQRSDLPDDQAFNVGDSLEVLVTGQDPQGGLLTVSHKKARQERLLRDMKVGMLVEGVVTGMNRGGLEVDLNGLRAFMPSGQVDAHFVKDISTLIGTKVRAEVTRFDFSDKNIVVSRRKVQLREAQEQKEKAFAELEVGQTVRGKVRNLADYGAFVDIGGVDGLLHVSDMSWGRVKHPQDVLKVDEEIEVKIIKINHEKKKVSLSLKQTTPNPWDGAAEKYPINAKVSGRVVRLANFGAFVELEPGLDALLPISEMSWTRRLRDPKELLKEGDVVEASVLSCDPDKQRISLSLKALKDDPWTVVAQNYAPGAKIKGKVVRTTDFGAFVNLEEGIDGLIHISELDDKRIRAVTDKVKVGDEVEVRVLGVDTEARKIALSLRAPPPEPTAEEIAEAKAKQQAIEKRRAKSKNRRGGITFGWDEGLSALDPSKFAR